MPQCNVTSATVRPVGADYSSVLVRAADKIVGTLCFPKISSAQVGQLTGSGEAACAVCSPKVRPLRHDGRLCCFDWPT